MVVGPSRRRRTRWVVYGRRSDNPPMDCRPPGADSNVIAVCGAPFIVRVVVNTRDWTPAIVYALGPEIPPVVERREYI